MPKKAYRVCNWGDYNRSLVSRGSLTFWISPEVVENWKSQKGEGHGNQKYSDVVITCGLTLRQLFRLPLRATQGMMHSLAKMMGLTVDIPDYSTLSRRGKSLKVALGWRAVPTPGMYWLTRQVFKFLVKENGRGFAMVKGGTNYGGNCISP